MYHFPHINISIPVSSVVLAVSEVLGSKVCLSRDKYNTMCCLESEQIGQRITTDWQTAQVHVLPMMQLNFKVSRVLTNKNFVNHKLGFYRSHFLRRLQLISV